MQLLHLVSIVLQEASVWSSARSASELRRAMAEGTALTQDKKLLEGRMKAPVCGCVAFLQSRRGTRCERNRQCSECSADPQPAGNVFCHLTNHPISLCGMGSVVSLPGQRTSLIKFLINTNSCGYYIYVKYIYIYTHTFSSMLRILVLSLWAKQLGSIHK